MKITNTTDYDKMTDDYNKSFPKYNKCTDSEFNFDIIIPSLLLTITCGLSFLCLLSLMVYTLVKPIIISKCWRNFYNQILQLEVS